jgi:hypothetical protein
MLRVRPGANDDSSVTRPRRVSDLTRPRLVVGAGASGGYEAQLTEVATLGGGFSLPLLLVPSVNPQKPFPDESEARPISTCFQKLLAPYFHAAGEFRGIDLKEIKLY